jgi:arsenate reductase-like glutaredoxin family protein
MDDSEIVERLLADARLIRLPLVRFGAEVSVGRDEATWKRWLSPDARGAGAGPTR